MFTFRVFPDGAEPYEVTARSRDIVQWEKTGKGRSFGRLANEANLSFSDLTSLAYVTAKRQGRYFGSLEEFEQSSDVEIVNEDAGEADPTQSAR
jgi:hypothetical protein